MDIKAKFGGNLNFIVAINPIIGDKAIDFIKVSLGINVVTAYSITEACGIIIASTAINPRSDYTGYPLKFCMVKVNYEKVLTKKEIKTIDEDFENTKKK